MEEAKEVEEEKVMTQDEVNAAVAAMTLEQLAIALQFLAGVTPVEPTPPPPEGTVAVSITAQAAPVGQSSKFAFSPGLLGQDSLTFVWGDGASTKVMQSFGGLPETAASHTYSSPGIYNVTASGTIGGKAAAGSTSVTIQGDVEVPPPVVSPPDPPVVTPPPSGKTWRDNLGLDCVRGSVAYLWGEPNDVRQAFVWSLTYAASAALTVAQLLATTVKYGTMTFGAWLGAHGKTLSENPFQNGMWAWQYASDAIDKAVMREALYQGYLVGSTPEAAAARADQQMAIKWNGGSAQLRDLDGNAINAYKGPLG
jgi:hypothetical protein